MSNPYQGPPPPQPIPVQALPYSLPDTMGMYRRRPGLITTIGVLCIIIACLSGITSFLSGLYGGIFYAMSKAATTMAVAPTVSTSVGTPAQTTSDDPLPAGDVGVAVNTLRPMLSLDPAHVRELDRFLRLHGRAVFPGDDDKPLTVAFIQNDISVLLKQNSSPKSKAQFSNAQGTVTVETDGAEFVAADGSTTIKTSARHHTDQTTVSDAAFSSTTVTGFNGSSLSITTLTPAQVTQVMAAVQTSSSGALNAAQIRSVRTAISAPNQSLVIAGSTSPVVSSFVKSNGNAAITFDTGSSLVLGPQGQVISSGAPGMTNFNIHGGVALALSIDAILSIALAIYLLVVGIMLFRDTFATRRLLRIYALLKIPLAIVAGIGMAMFAYQFAVGISKTPPATFTPSPSTFTAWGVALTLFGLAFPIALLIALRSRTARDYYTSTRST